MKVKLFAVAVLLLFSVSGALCAPNISTTISDYISILTKTTVYTYYTGDSVQDLEDFLNNSDVDKTEYFRDGYNCVNFSSDLIHELELHGFTASNTRMHKENGTAITDDMHMIVAVKLGDKIVFVEPQTDTILTYDELEQHYSEYRFTDIVIYDLFGYSTILSFNGWHSDSTMKMFEVEL